MMAQDLGFRFVGFGRPPVGDTFDQVALAGSKVCRSLTTCPVPPPDTSPVQQEGRCKATRKREFKLRWREAGPPNHHDDKVDSVQ